MVMANLEVGKGIKCQIGGAMEDLYKTCPKKTNMVLVYSRDQLEGGA